MKPSVVAQDEMFPDVDPGWMEMDEVQYDDSVIVWFGWLSNKTVVSKEEYKYQMVSISILMFSCT